jgi:putative ABC transport system permease protein
MQKQLLRWISVRHARRAPGMLLLSLAGVALGVAVFVAIQVANRTVIRTFSATLDAVSGRANLEIAAGSGGLPDRLYPAVRGLPGVEAATPLVVAQVLLPDHPGEVVGLIGVDPFSNQPFGTGTAVFDTALAGAPVTGAPPHGAATPGAPPPAELGSAPAFLRWVADPRAALAPEALARDLGLELGSQLRILAGSEPDSVTIRGFLRFPGDVGRTAERFLVLDVAAAQEIAGRVGQLDRIDLIAADPEAAASALAALPLLPADAEVRRPETRTQQVETLLAAFRLNLTALSLIALFVGTFLVYNAATTAVIRRRREIGILMALGVPRPMIERLVLGENLILGALGIALGLGLGILLARLVLSSIARTVSSLYIQVAVRELFIEPAVLAVAAAAGLVAVVAATWLPAREAARLVPQVVLTEGRRPSWRGPRPERLLLLGLLVSAGALGLAMSPLLARAPLLSFAVALLLLAGAAFASPAVTMAVAALARPWSRRHPALGLAAAELKVGIRRTAVAVAALGSALAMVVGISIMIESFRRTVDEWIGQTVRADLYVAPASQIASGRVAVLAPEVVRAAEQLPGVRAVDRLRTLAGLQVGGRPVRAAAVVFGVLAQESPSDFLAVDPALGAPRTDPAAVLRAAARSGAVLASEPLARRHGYRAGDTLRVRTPAGEQSWRIAGVFRDYSSDSGLLLIDYGVYARVWGDSAVSGLALYLTDPARGPEVRQALLARTAPRYPLLVRSHHDLRAAALAEFDQTFAVTQTLKLITLIVALAGVFFALTVGIAERRAEIGVLRALGASGAQVRRMVLAEAMLIGAAALVIGVVTGVGLAVVLVFVVNPQFFGWTIRWAPTARPFLEALAVVVVSALLAAWLPARAAVRSEPAASLRAE